MDIGSFFFGYGVGALMVGGAWFWNFCRKRHVNNFKSLPEQAERTARSRHCARYCRYCHQEVR